jgi:hypothetical protein
MTPVRRGRPTKTHAKGNNHVGTSTLGAPLVALLPARLERAVVDHAPGQEDPRKRSVAPVATTPLRRPACPERAAGALQRWWAIGIACELAYLSRKPVGELEQAMLRTRAFVSLLRCTGMRSITAVTLRLEQFTEAGSESGALLLKRMERKCGSARNVEKPVYVCVVPHADPKLCPIVRIAAAREIDPAYELFAEGFTHKIGQDYVSFATMVQRRYIAILQYAAVAIGVPALFSGKKLHAFRVQCTNVLGSTGASEAERECHSAGRARCRAAITAL